MVTPVSCPCCLTAPARSILQLPAWQRLVNAFIDMRHRHMYDMLSRQATACQITSRRAAAGMEALIA